ncbi:MAG: GNAT family N-acetyltransferase [Undibacterium umbellatum]|uniref:GNAT family N-acetyltransferase n=1 Tax=Undibacterium umbellatum TaxID=2762300 RepID=UPI003BB5C2F2
MELTLESCRLDDATHLADIRVLAMRLSLERIRRLDPERARQRLLVNFAAEYTRLIKLDGSLAGFLVLRPQDNDLLLDHFYLHSDFQQRGLGSEAINLVLVEADAQGKILHAGALRASDANRFTFAMASFCGKWPSLIITIFVVHSLVLVGAITLQ